MKLFNKLSRWRARRRQLARLERALLALPEVDRRVYLLCTAAKLPYGVVAGRLDLTTAQVEHHLAQALVTIATIMDETAEPTVALDEGSR